MAIRLCIFADAHIPASISKIINFQTYFCPFLPNMAIFGKYLNCGKYG